MSDEPDDDAELFIPAREQSPSGVLPDMVEVAADQARYDDRVVLSVLARMVSVTDYLTDEKDAEGNVTAKALTLDECDRLRSLALFDLFSGYDEEFKAGRLTKPDLRRRETPATLAALRLHPRYEEVKGAVQEKAADLKGCETIDDWSVKIQGVMVREHLRPALRSKSVRDCLKAASEFTDRVSAKKAREGEGSGGRVLIIPDSLIAALTAGLERSQKYLGRGDIDASVLNTTEKP